MARTKAARTKAMKTRAMKTKASSSKSKSGCSACKERRLSCDETLPTCQRCRHDGRECKGISERISASSETLPPSNTSLAVNAESLPSAVETPPSDASAPDNRTLMDLTCVKDPISNNGEAEPGASQTHNALGVEEGPLTTESEWLEEQEKRLQEPQNVRPVAPGSDPYQALALGALERAEQLTGCEGSENSKKRTAGVVPLATIDRSKRGRGDKDDQKIKEWITVSFGPARDYIETASEREPLPVSEASRPASPTDALDIPPSDGFEAVQKAQMALSVANARVNIPPTPKIEPSHPPTHPSGIQSLRIVECSTHPHQDLSSTTEGLGAALREGRGNTAVSSESGNHQCDSQPASPASIPPCSSQERSNLHVPSNARQSSASVPIETEQDPGRSWNVQRTGNHPQSAPAGQRKPRPLVPRRIAPTMKQSQAAPANGLLPTHRQGACNNGSASSLEAMAGLNDSCQVPPHQQARYQPISRGGGDSLVNHNHRQPLANIANTGNPTPWGNGSGSQLRLQEQHPHPSSPTLPLQRRSYHPPPNVRFTEGTRIEGTLPQAAIQPYFELFSKHGQIIVQPKKTSRVKRLPMSAIMWQSASTFHRWYMTETGTADVSTLRFELLNGESKLEKIFFDYDGDADTFRMLKQSLWDLFWARFSLDSATATFQVLIRDFHRLPSEDFLHGPVVVSASDMNPVASPWCSATTRFEDVGVVGPQMGLAEYAPEQRQSVKAPQLRDSSSQRMAPLPGPEIIIRLQIDRMGRVSEPYGRSVLGPRTTTRDFFAWFVSKTGRGGDDTPSSLTFTFKDAMPAPISSTVGQSNEDHFNLMKRDIQTQFDKANNLASGLKEFAIFVTDPNWVVEEDPW